ncbi:class I SAM-dependent methyltransferase [Brucella tritici]|uniref:class I SAM-dependent methyltransferase n=1 Tax=Brucella tritici TaxID=94626 RepID=UPI00200122CB|nr:class I SAM-dependent methyltransferase [Brucella tritici]
MYLSRQSFAPSLHIRSSAWLEHSPFIFWLIDILRPSRLVELGTHNGFSFLSQCQVAKSIDCDATIYAIDTWKGDEHAGFYDAEVYDNLEVEVRINYPRIGRLIKSTFAAARSQFNNGSVDLLHIDGRHRYEDVKEDFDTWVGTLSDRGVVLFHDTCVRRDDFGVYRFWSEISQKYPSFEFYHGNGLGILIIGNRAPGILTDLCSDSFETKSLVRDAYARLGYINTLQFEIMKITSEGKNLLYQVKSKELEINRYSDILNNFNDKLMYFHTELETAEREHHQQISEVHQEKMRLQSELRELENLKNSMLASTSWKITRPLRAIKAFFSPTFKL